ncbi:MAG: metallophosphoesterase [SAR324 cluster bacterium]|nr:metallophosphoesterase [SAR324 cluster bacterium]
MNLIGDIHGNYQTLLALLKQMPDEEPVSVGDMIDRGPRSRKVLEFFMKHGRALLGNHEHMMLDHLNGGGDYERGLWFMNGGNATLASLGQNSSMDSLIQFVKDLPLWIRMDDLVVTHAPIQRRWEVEDLSSTELLEQNHLDRGWLWTREDPEPREGAFQVFGHNGYRYRSVRFFSRHLLKRPETSFAACIDTNLGRVLSGMHWPSRKVFVQEYLD